jgi:hypothetical protein
MQKSDKRKFVEVLTSLSDLYDFPVSKNALQLFWDILKEYPIDAFVAAAKKHTETSKWMPKPSDFISAIKSLSTSGEEKAVLAWTAVTKATRSVGGNASVEFDDPLIHAVVRNLGGWSTLCSSSATYFQNNTRKQFISTYESMYNLCAKGLRVDGLLPLEGRTRDRLVQIKTDVPQGPQHLLLGSAKTEILPEGSKNGDAERVKSLISGISKATKINSNSRGVHNEVLQGKKEKRTQVKRIDGDD